jgi:hypothetical protein
MPIDIPKHAIATHPIRKTIDGVSAYTPIFVKLDLGSDLEKAVAESLNLLAGNGSEDEIRVFDKETLLYTFDGVVKEMRVQDGVAVLAVAKGVVRYPRASD